MITIIHGIVDGQSVAVLDEDCGVSFYLDDTADYMVGDYPPNYPVPAIRHEAVTLFTRHDRPVFAVVYHQVERGPGYWKLVGHEKCPE